MALTQDLIDFLELGVSHQIGACSRDGRPTLCRALAARPEPDGRLVVVLSGESGFEVLASVRETARVALNLTLPENYRSVSLLGRDAEVGQGGADFRELVLDRYRKFRAQLEGHGIPPSYTEAWYLRPDDDLMTIRFTPFAARNQTPGPDAGSAMTLRTR